MPGEQSPAVSHRLLNLAEKMHDKQYRDGYVAAHTRQMLAKQMREFRGAMPQTEFAELIHKRQTMVSRLENPNYSGWTLSTLFEIASKLNVAVFVRFIDFPTFLRYSGDQTEAALHPAAYSQQRVDDFARSETEFEAAAARALGILRTPLRDELRRGEIAGRLAAQEAQEAIMLQGAAGPDRKRPPEISWPSPSGVIPQPLRTPVLA